MADSDGVVWYKVVYKNKTGYVMRDYARLVVGIPHAVRTPASGEDDLGNLFLKSVSAVFAGYESAAEAAEGYAAAVRNERYALYGNDYVQKIEVTGEGVTLWGAAVGDDIAAARKTLEENGLWLAEDNDDTVIFEHICSPDSLLVTDAGFDALLKVTVADGKVTAMTAEAYAK